MFTADVSTRQENENPVWSADCLDALPVRSGARTTRTNVCQSVLYIRGVVPKPFFVLAYGHKKMPGMQLVQKTMKPIHWIG